LLANFLPSIGNLPPDASSNALYASLVLSALASLMDLTESIRFEASAT